MTGRRIEPWPIVVDTREQTPLDLAGAIERIGAPFTVTRGTLPCGDYALQDFPDVFAIERKSLADLVACATSNRARFERALARMALRCRHRCIVVEASIDDVLAHRYRSDASPWAIVSSASGWWLDYGVSTIWAGNRDAGAELVLRMFGSMRRRIERSADVVVEGAA